MRSIINMPWISQEIEVFGSTDPTLVGITGRVVDETRRTIAVRTPKGVLILAKDTINFRIGEEEIEGQYVGQRPEERIGKRYRRA